MRASHWGNTSFHSMLLTRRNIKGSLPPAGCKPREIRAAISVISSGTPVLRSRGARLQIRVRSGYDLPTDGTTRVRIAVRKSYFTAKINNKQSFCWKETNVFWSIFFKPFVLKIKEINFIHITDFVHTLIGSLLKHSSKMRWVIWSQYGLITNECLWKCEERNKTKSSEQKASFVQVSSKAFSKE